MKTDLSKINKEEFYIHEKLVGSETVYLVYPKIGATWTNDNLIYRSSMWNQDGELISAGFKKFFNWAEQPDITPAPYAISGCQLLEKIDGSCLIISNYKGNLIVRTRGSDDTITLANHYEIEYFKQRFPKIFDFKNDCLDTYSYIYEWVSPDNRIVIDYKEADLYLTGIVRHIDYYMFSQEFLNADAKYLGVKRPSTFNFNTFDEMFTAVKEFKGIEGICVYYNHGQNIRKLKGIEYLMLHKFRFDLSMENVLDMYLRYDQPDYKTFLKKIEAEFDFECVSFVIGFASQICDAAKEVKKIIEHMKKFADSVRSLSRKDAAFKIIEAYGKTSRSGYVFNFLDNKIIENEGIKKLYFQIIKNSK